MRLISGDATEPSTVYELKKENEKLQKQLALYQSGGLQNIANELKMILQKSGGLIGLSGDKNQLERLLSDNKSILEHLDELLARGGGGSGRVGNHSHVFMKQPVPFPDFDGSIQRGITYRVASSQLNVGNKDGEPLVTSNPYETAFWQLQLQECMELLHRKDAALSD